MGYAWYLIILAIALTVTGAQDAILQEVDELRTRIR